MAESKEVKRLNYFKYQFLQAQDFIDEQGYHRDMRRRHNRLLHTWGVAEGLEVSKTDSRRVSIAKGSAVDKEGRELVLLDGREYPLKTSEANAVFFLTAAYDDAQDPADHYVSGGVDDYTRVTERVIINESKNPPADGSLIALAQVELDQNGNISDVKGKSANWHREQASARIAPGAIPAEKLEDSLKTNLGTLTAGPTSDATNLHTHKIAPNKLDGVSVNVTTANLNTLTAGPTSDATNLHTHKIAPNKLDGVSVNVTTANLNTLTAGPTSDATNLHTHKIAPTSLDGVSTNVTATNLNTLTAGPTSNASNLHYHQTIPAQDRTYIVPLRPAKWGSNPEFDAALPFVMNIPPNIAPAGTLLVDLPHGAQVNKLQIFTSGEAVDFSVIVSLGMVQYNVNTLSVLRDFSITSTGEKELALNVVIDNNLASYCVLIQVAKAPAKILSINGIKISYKLGRLF